MNPQVISILEQKNVKPTPMRMLVLEQLLLQSQNATLSEIEKLLYPADRITIYRTLQTFVNQGIIHAIEASNKGVYYALCLSNCSVAVHVDNHPHFYCERCNKTTCCDDFMYRIKEIQKSNYQITKVELYIKGICPNCIT
jgi:Fur family transcriptional regulator, ferric uptake regulator